MRGIVRNFFRSALAASERGATAVEYGLICAMIVLGMIVALQGVATKTMNMWNNVSNEVSAH
ncbi:Flp family type IVb pilin [Sphingobium sp. SCG-1]|uniref:Flp family type IVb pilin n=1 Tax=Sphingobium sp. SCG-1 TaxID=2072936 RepID=UPI000CD67F66|nr:Flp family type IVb pilin [Sphingobium sp. SCG-1]AUW58855.1 Flp family type IVb pilin [Sphingobium sp. SCG-1]